MSAAHPKFSTACRASSNPAPAAGWLAAQRTKINHPHSQLKKMGVGRILLHCFGGCPNGDVLAAIGLRMSDLFDKPIAHHLPPVRGGFSARELLELNAHEALVAAMLATKAGDEGLTPEEAQRLRRAAARLTKAKDFSNAH